MILTGTAYLPLTGGALTGNLLFSSDNTLDIGAAGATRPRTVYFGTSLIGSGQTVTASAPVLDLTQTWNNSGVTFTGIKLNVTNTASAAASRQIALQDGGVDRLILSAGGQANYAWIGVKAGEDLEIRTTTRSAFANVNAAIFQGTAGVFSGAEFRLGAVNYSSADVKLAYDAANTLALRNGSSPQELRPYGYYNSATSRAYGVVKCANEAVTLSGATTATANIIPVGAFVIGVAVTITTAISGASGYQVGDGSDADRWGDITGTAIGTDSDNTDSTANPTGYFAAASAITLTAKTSNFTGGVAQVTVFYLSTGAD